jgi:hypothetical protein
MNALQAPYFLWDYDLTEADVRSILRGNEEEKKAWLVARLLESARYADIWQYISLSELQMIFPKLQLKPPGARRLGICTAGLDNRTSP